MATSSILSALSSLSACTAFSVSSVVLGSFYASLHLDKVCIDLILHFKIVEDIIFVVREMLEEAREDKKRRMCVRFERKGDKGRMLARCIGARFGKRAGAQREWH